MYFKHGLTKTPEYLAWQNMKRRCYDKKYLGYSEWGGRGITVCSDWLTSFQCFYSDMGKKPQGYSLDRIDNNGNYEPSNCRWADAKTQANNQRIKKTNTSGVSGIAKNKGGWIVRVRGVYCGWFKDLQQAKLKHSELVNERA